MQYLKFIRCEGNRNYNNDTPVSGITRPAKAVSILKPLDGKVTLTPAKSPTKSVLPDISEDVKIIKASLAAMSAQPPKVSPKRGKSKKSRDTRTECIVCSLPGNNRTLVR